MAATSASSSATIADCRGLLQTRNISHITGTNFYLFYLSHLHQSPSHPRTTHRDLTKQTALHLLALRCCLALAHHLHHEGVQGSHVIAVLLVAATGSMGPAEQACVSLCVLLMRDGVTLVGQQLAQPPASKPSVHLSGSLWCEATAWRLFTECSSLWMLGAWLVSGPASSTPPLAA